ncbi:MAG: hypothetical protein CO022_07820 [Flavobacteriales bacterium CG_4_9_14_0_2_um_filter_32_27]|nr:MAG: hypothetical protein CO022_07820 [Flavobacteriales bacterium CG_4_9_14_0_2_um_filter_32_27]
MTVTETTDGNKTKNRIPIWTWIWVYLISFPFRLLALFIGRRKNYFEVTDSEWTDLYPFPTDGHKIERKIIAETGFDGFIKFFHLRTADKKINDLLRDKIFGDFYWEKDYGIFLRQFDTPDEWPISYLVFIDTKDFSFQRLKKVNSSFAEWKYEGINDTDFNILIEWTKTYTTRLTIKK